MATENRKVQLGVGVDATGAKQGFDQVKADAQSMAQVVGKAGQDAAKGVDAIGASAQQSGEKLEAANKKFEASIRKAMELQTALAAGPRGSSGFIAERAKQAGADVKALEPLLAQLRAVEAAQNKVALSTVPAAAGINNLGMSARALSANLRGVPAQFTDIVTSLQAGQRPLSVLLQQGGQLKDMFGGIGPAARALGGYVLGLVNPFTVTAAVVGTLGYALHAGSEELRGFQKAATISGNALGSSASAFNSLRDSVAGIGATKGKAAAVLTEIAENGKLAGSSIKSIAEAAILMEKATGQATAKTIAQFAELAKSPTDAVAKLNEQYNFLTTAVFRQVKALEDQGKALQAANLAEDTYAGALKARAQAVIDNAGIIEKAWRGISGAAKGAWDAMLGVGRSLSPTEKLAQAAQDVARIQAQIVGVGTFGETGGGAATGGASAARKTALEGQLSVAQQALHAAQRRVEIEARNTHEKAEQNRLSQLGIDFIKQGDEFLTKQEKMAREINKARVEGQELVKNGLITQLEIEKRIAGIREKYKESGSGSAGVGENEVAGIRARTKAAQQELSRLLSGDPESKLTEGEKLVIKIKEELTTTIKAQARAQKELALVAAESLAIVDRQVANEQAYQKALKESQATLERQVDAVQKQADAIRDQAAGQEAVNEHFGKSKTAIEQATLAQQKLQLLEAQESSQFAPAYVAALTAKTDAQKRYVDALQQTEFLQANQKLEESGREAREIAESLKLEVSLLGQSQESRERIIAQRRVEVRLARELAAIEKLNLGEGPEAAAKREELRAKARANAVIEGDNAMNKVLIDNAQKTADSINNSLTDALLRGFESGKGFAENFRDTLVNMFKTLVLRPIISATLSPISQALGGLTQSLVGGAGGAGGSGTLGLASNAYSLYNGGSSLVTVGGQVLGGSMSLANGAGTLYANATGAGLDGLLATNAAYGTAGGAAGGAGAGGAIATLGPIVAIAAFLYAAYKFSQGETRGGGQYGYSFDGKTVENFRRGRTQDAEGVGATLLEGPSGGDPAADISKLIVNSTVSSINAAMSAIGTGATLTAFQAAYETSDRSRGGVFAGGTLSNGVMFGESGTGDNYPDEHGYDPNRSLYETWGQADQRGGNMTGTPEMLAIDAAQSYIEAIQASVGIIPQIIKEKITVDNPLFDSDGNNTAIEKMDLNRWVRVYDENIRESVKTLGLLPKKIADLIVDIDPEALSDEATKDIATKVQALVGNVNGFRAIVEALPVERLRNLSFDIASSLVEFAGGLEKFAAGISSYVENFYSDAEKRTFVAGNISKELAKAGLNIGTDELLTKTRDSFRALVEAQDLTTESGQKAYTALLNVAGSFASITQVVEDADTAIDQYADQIKKLTDSYVASDKALAAARASSAAEWEKLKRSIATSTIGDAVTRAQQELDAVRGPLQQAQEDQNNQLLSTVESLRSFANGLKELREQLDLGAQSGLSGADRYGAAKAALSGATAETAPELVRQFLDAAKEQASSGLVYQSDVDLAKSVLASLETSAVSQANAIESQISAANSMAIFAASAKLQLAQFNQTTYGASQETSAALLGPLLESLFGESGMAKEVFEAWARDVLNLSVTLPGYAGGGLASGWAMVGERGPEVVNFDQPARVYSSSQTAGMFGRGGDDSRALREELREVKSILAAIASHANRTAIATGKTERHLGASASGNNTLFMEIE